MTLTHANTNNWADSSGDVGAPGVKHHNGLTDFGKQVVAEMNRLGMMVDISHVSDKTFWDVMEVSKAPPIASHSSCRALAAMPRNVTDDQIRAIAKGGGIIMVNVSSLFLSQASIDGYLAARKAAQPQIDALQEKYKDDPATRDAEIQKVKDAISYPDADWKVAVDHIERVLKLGGPGAAGLGTDYDGISDPPAGMEDVSTLPKLTEELLRRGHSETVVRGVLGENFLRFWDRAEAAKKSVPPRTGPLPFSKPK